jgi:hypothetical protein
MLTELLADNFGSGLFGVGIGIFGSVIRSSVNMPTPTKNYEVGEK